MAPVTNAPKSAAPAKVPDFLDAILKAAEGASHPKGIADLFPTDTGGVFGAVGAGMRRALNDPSGAWSEGASVDPAKARARAKEAIASAPAVPSSHPYAKHVDDVRARLAKKGLPTEASGVRVMVAGEDHATHGTRTTRMVAGERIGLARHADVQTSGGVDTTEGDPKSNAARDTRSAELAKKKKAGAASIGDLAEQGAIRMDESFDSARHEIHDAKLRHLAAKDGKTSVLTMSWGTKPHSEAEKLAKGVSWSSPAGKEAIAAWEKKSGEKFDPSKLAHVGGVKRLMVDTIAGQIADRVAKAGDTDSKKALKAEAIDAKSSGLVIFKSAGNENKGGVAGAIAPRDPRTTWSSTHDIPGIITVGNADIGQPGAKDDKMWAKSSAGQIEIAAPGTNVPVAKIDGAADDRSGTSYSAPYAASVAALMIKANPKITPTEIEVILTSKYVARDLPGDLDGAGLIDPVAAVEIARDFGRMK